MDDGGGLICLVVGDNEHMRVSLTAAHTHASRDGKLSDPGLEWVRSARGGLSGVFVW